MMLDVKKIIDVNKRWEDGVEHNQKSINIFNFLKAYDFKFFDDYFCWKSGGDGDNGEALMYQLDEYFDSDFYKELEVEIRKPLEYRIDYLENENENLKVDIENLKDQNFGYGRIKYLEDEIKRFKFESENIQKAIQHIDEAKYNAQQERQKVIAELKDWFKKEDVETKINEMIKELKDGRKPK